MLLVFVRSRPFAWLMIITNLVFILGITLFPFKFSWNDRPSMANSFGLARDIARRGNDLLIGVDGGLGQAFKGRIDDLRIDHRPLTAAEIALEGRGGPGTVLSFAFDENSGDFVTDASGNGNHGRFVRGPQWVTGKHGAALRFDGSGQYVRVPNSSSLDIGGHGITISMWIALEGPKQRFDQVVLAKPWRSNSMDYPAYQYAIEFDTNHGQSVDFYFGDTSGRLRGPFMVWPPLGVWKHVAFTYDGVRVHGYVDGREQLAADLNPWEVRDVVLNVLFFMPLGFGICVLMIEPRAKRYSAPAILLLITFIAFSLSLSIEIAQSLLPIRTSSLHDVAANTIGAAVGGLCCLLTAVRGANRFPFR